MSVNIFSSTIFLAKIKPLIFIKISKKHFVNQKKNDLSGTFHEFGHVGQLIL